MDHDRRHEAISRTEAVAALEGKTERPGEDSSFALLRDNITEAVRILVLRRWTFFIPFCAVTSIAAVASHWLPRTYQSTTIIERRDHPVLINLRQTAATGGFARFFRPTLARDLKSLEAMIEVVERLGLVKDLPRNADGTLTEEGRKLCRTKAAALAGGVSARLVQKTEHFDQIKITFVGSDPDLPQRVVNEVKNTYIRRMRARLTEMLTEAKSYFDGVAQQQRDKIAALEEEMLRFQAEYIGIDPTNPGALKLKLTSLESERAELTREVTALEREIESRERTIELYRRRARRLAQSGNKGMVELPQMASSAEAQALENEIHKLQQEIHEFQLVRRMTERHPDIVDRRARIGRLRERLKAQYLADARALPANRGATLDHSPTTDANVRENMAFASVQLDIHDRKSRLEAAQSRLRIIEADIRKHQALEANIFRYRKDFKLKSDLLTQTRADYGGNSRRSLEIAGILNADESERGISFTELTRPTPCTRPLKPRGTTVLLLSLLAGLAAGAVSVLLKELFDQRYHTTRQVTRSLGLPILESVDEIITSVDRARLFRRRAIYAPAIVSVLLAVVGVSCGTAFLSLEKPRAYEQVMRVPTAIWGRISEGKLLAYRSGRRRSHQGAPQPPTECAKASVASAQVMPLHARELISLHAQEGGIDRRHHQHTHESVHRPVPGHRSDS